MGSEMCIRDRLCIDQNNNISGACSSSGQAYKMPGRVGDSPIIGSGLFIDNKVGGAVATGLGEEIIKTVGSFLVVELIRQGFTPQEACESAVKRIVSNNSQKNRFQVAYIAMNKNCLLYTSPSPRDLSTSRMPSSA